MRSFSRLFDAGRGRARRGASADDDAIGGPGDSGRRSRSRPPLAPAPPPAPSGRPEAGAIVARGPDATDPRGARGRAREPRRQPGFSRGKRKNALSEALRAIGGVGAGGERKALGTMVLPRRATSGRAYLLIAQERARSPPSLARALAPRRSSARGDAPRASSLDARARLPPATDRAASRRRPPRPRGRGRRGGDAEASRRHRARRPPARVDEARREPATRGCGAEAVGAGGGKETSDARARAKQKRGAGERPDGIGQDEDVLCVKKQVTGQLFTRIGANEPSI